MIRNRSRTFAIFLKNLRDYYYFTWVNVTTLNGYFYLNIVISIHPFSVLSDFA